MLRLLRTRVCRFRTVAVPSISESAIYPTQSVHGNDFTEH
jgi:hypothetical protein